MMLYRDSSCPLTFDNSCSTVSVCVSISSSRRLKSWIIATPCSMIDGSLDDNPLSRESVSSTKWLECSFLHFSQINFSHGWQNQTRSSLVWNAHFVDIWWERKWFMYIEYERIRLIHYTCVYICWTMDKSKHNHKHLVLLWMTLN